MLAKIGHQETIREGKGDAGAMLPRQLQRMKSRRTGGVTRQEIAFQVDPLRLCHHLGINILGVSCAEAPRDVFMVRSPSGVTRIKHTPVCSAGLRALVKRMPSRVKSAA